MPTFELLLSPFSSFPDYMLKTSLTVGTSLYQNVMLSDWQKVEKVDIEVKITCGTPTKKIIQQEASACNATWVILDRHLKRDEKFYQGQILCKLALVADDWSIRILTTEPTTGTDNTEIKVVLYRSKHVQLSAPPDTENVDQSIISHSYSASFGSFENLEMPSKKHLTSLMHKSWGQGSILTDDIHCASKQDGSGSLSRAGNKHSNASLIIGTSPRRKRSSTTPVLCDACGMTTELYIKESMKFSFSEIHLATNYFSDENLLGEGGYGRVYKGQLSDGQIIAAKVRKQASTQGFEEFHSEIYVLSFARHRNIVVLLGYCCKENINILVYEYICNRSLEWHLFDQSANGLEWHQRHAIAIGTAKGLRFLHEECRSSPIIHRDLRPSNILLTHDFVPMLGDFGLAKWKTNDSPIQTRILGTLGYLAPEYAENGMVSVRTDVYAYGITLIQLISGRKAVSSNSEDHHQSLRQWAEPLVESLALHDLIDQRLGDSYDPFELYHMAKTAYLCVKVDPEKRPSMGEVVQLLEGETDHFKNLTDQFLPHYNH
ncbi:serine/threonine-protein kinase CDG1-like [Cynara cardunculus var. scolymus]|uniref:serine/threonine-protein kinase CDG1-like n=1 Tax=Cynara cardunculus var. scolymus TaxID=59895 RepID=UPI000D630E4E|nr:serine/threonine-protein kinase CDG1-like [Cynara cardunculus var. scolymus]